ncbi:general stress protein [Nocardioides sp. LHD-245]|uniref:general stress protein n=1 Tax=Nocardioides sp. LHD-245 TaxID=3051387 RepID=UPI0027E056E2|nr:general stress protein [Nocardioides sp. LHD-245]
MSNPTPGGLGRPLLTLEFPQSLAVYDDYTTAQRTVDFLSDEGFPVQNCMIVGTDLKQVERITGRLTSGRVAAGGAMSGLWFGLFVGVLFSFFGTGDTLAIIASTVLLGVAFGVVFALAGYAVTRGQRDFSSVSSVVATRYEVLVEHKVAAQARELLAKLPGALPNPFA